MRKNKIFNVDTTKFKAMQLKDSPEFYSRDTDAFLTFTVPDESFEFDNALLYLINIDDGSVITEIETEILGQANVEFEITPEIMAHYGRWRGQIVFEKDGEKASSAIFDFIIKRFLTDERPPTLNEVESIAKLRREAKELIEVLEGMTYDNESLVDVLQAKDGELTLDARIRRDVNNLENKKADKAEVSAQLAQKANVSDIAGLSSLTPTFVTSVNDMVETTIPYVNTSNGFIYLYNSETSSFENSGVQYQATGLNEKSVRPRHIDLRENALHDVEFAMGAINGGAEDDPDRIGRIRSLDYVKVTSGETFNIVNNDFSFNIFFYESDEIDSYIGAASSVFLKTYTMERDCYVRILLSKDSGGNLTEYVPEAHTFVELLRYPEVVTKGESISHNIISKNHFTPELKNELFTGGSDNEVDLIMFMGQSNMAGRGVASEAPVMPPDIAYEFRAISDPTKLYPLSEPFGATENVSESISETSKTGSMVSSFAIEYNKLTNRPIVGVSASQGGTSINEWQPNAPKLNDAINRYHIAKAWLFSNGYTIKNEFMVWCQGETDAAQNMPKGDYLDKTKSMIEAMIAEGIEKCFIVRIGNRENNSVIEPKQQAMMSWQNELCQTYKHAVMVSTKFGDMISTKLDLMKADGLHYQQEAYNITGADAGINTAFYINNGKEPYMYDGEHSSVYFPQN